MCGFGLILRTVDPDTGTPHDERIPDAWLDALDDAVEYRGPDGFGRDRRGMTFDRGREATLGLTHRRLSILDHEDGAQPMSLPGDERGGPLTVVFNGNIDNHRELRDELEADGHRFRTGHSDTEVLLHGYRAWGMGLRDRLEGMYAFAVVDEDAGEVAVFRDRFGQKPLYVLDDGENATLALCSSAAGLHRLASIMPLPDGAGCRLDAEHLVRWISLGYHDSQTPWRGIWQVAPDTAGLWSASSGWSRITKPRPIPGSLRRSMPSGERQGTLVDRVLGLLDRAVVRRLDADVPVGAFLSGGVDSSVVAALAQRHLAAGGETLTTLCVQMPDERYDESEHAQQVADALGTSHLTVPAEPNPAEDLVYLIHTLGLPFGDSSLLPTFWVSNAAAEHVGVALSGDGGDELFLGYQRYQAAEWIGTAALASGLGVDRLLPRRDPKSVWDKAARLSVAAANEGYEDVLAIFQTPERRRLIASKSAEASLRRSPVDSISRAQHHDLRHHLPGDYLRKVDTASMAAALEVRAPLLDNELADAVLRLPVSRLRHRGQRKGLLRAIARTLVPPEVIDRPKMGFAIPIGEWFRTDFGGMRTLLHDQLGSADPFPHLDRAGVVIDTREVERLRDEHDRAYRDHSQRLYVLLVVSIWANWLAAGHKA